MFGEIIQFVPHIVGYSFTVLLSLLIGYHLREKGHERDQLTLARGYKAREETVLEEERAVQRELEIACLQAGQAIEKMAQELEAEKKRADFNDGFRKALVDAIVINYCWDFQEHGNDPSKMLKHLVNYECQLALDPAISKPANNLYIRGVRKGAKQGRTQMAKLMQKSIDNQAATIASYTKTWDAQTKRFVRYKQAVQATVNDKIGLPGVRRAFFAALEQDFALRNDLAKSKGE